MHLVDNMRCNFCDVENESICHVYWECRVTQMFWIELENYITNLVQHFTVTKERVWFGDDDNLHNYIFCSAKRYIYTLAL